MGRLRQGVSIAQAEANLDQIAKEIDRTFPNEANPRARFHLTQPGLIGDNLRKPITGFSVVLGILAGLVLLLACMNLAGMLLARASDRHREVGIRLALGASRLRLLRQLMIESLLLASAGGTLGLGLAVAGCYLFTSWHPNLGIPIDPTLRPDGAVLCFTLLITFATTLIFGLVPAFQSIQVDILPSLRNFPVSDRLRRLSTRDFLVAAQIALSVVLVICSALVIRSLQHALTLNLGYNPAHAVSVSFDLRLKGYSAEGSRRFAADLLQKASEVPGFQAFGLTSNMPLRIDHGNNSVISRKDRPLPKMADLLDATIYNILRGYLQAAGTQLHSGRDFEARDRNNAQAVTIINEALAHQLFPNENPLGKSLRLGTNPADKGLAIVGIVETGKYEYLGEDPRPAVFRPIAQAGVDWTTIVARSQLPEQTATALLRKTVLNLNPEMALSHTGSLENQLALPLFPARIAATILSLFGFVAMTLAATGLFALVAYSVARRTREIGIRIALGARSGQLLTAVFSRIIVLCAVGISIGTILTLLTGRLLSVVLYGVSPQDPAAYLSALLLMISVALLACCNPAVRVLRTDPAYTLRQE